MQRGVYVRVYVYLLTLACLSKAHHKQQVDRTVPSGSVTHKITGKNNCADSCSPAFNLHGNTNTRVARALSCIKCRANTSEATFPAGVNESQQEGSYLGDAEGEGQVRELISRQVEFIRCEGRGLLSSGRLHYPLLRVALPCLMCNITLLIFLSLALLRSSPLVNAPTTYYVLFLCPLQSSLSI